MQIADSRIEELQKLYYESFGEAISKDMARRIGLRLLDFISQGLNEYENEKQHKSLLPK